MFLGFCFLVTFFTGPKDSLDKPSKLCSLLLWYHGEVHTVHFPTEYMLQSLIIYPSHLQCSELLRVLVGDTDGKEDLLFSHSVVSDPLWPHGLQHARLPCPSLSPRACSNSCSLSHSCHPTISSSVTLFSSSIFPSIRVFSNELTLCIRWPEYWSFSFSISPSSEYSELI